MSDERLEREVYVDGRVNNRPPDPGAPLGPHDPLSPRALAREAFVEETFSELSDERGVPAEVRELVQRCMDGSEPTDRPLKVSEPRAFNAANVQTVLLRAAGFRQVEIARVLGQSPESVSIICRHPYGRKIIHAMIHKQTGRVLDIRTRLEEYAGDVLDHTFALAMVSEDLEEVSKIGFGLLDRAGYGPTQRIQQVPPTAATSEHVMTRVAHALEQSSAVDTHIMPGWTPRPPPEEGLRGESGSSESSSPPAGDPASELTSGVRLAKVAGT